MQRSQLTGQRFGRLVVLREDGSQNNHSMWQCVCDCGSVKRIAGIHLRSGRIKACGCLQKERASIANTTHGYSKTACYDVWQGMISRCYDTSKSNFKDYGGRGISVCSEWRVSFEQFWSDMGPSYQKGLMLDRRDNNGNYCPDNCRWATRKVQNRNRRNCVFIETPKGKMIISEAAEEFGIKRTTLVARIKRGLTGAVLFGSCEK